jgi:hypothetical protein
MGYGTSAGALMSQEQKKIVVYWFSLFAVCLVGAGITLVDMEYKKLALLFLLFLIACTSLIQDFSFYVQTGASRGRLGEFIESHPLLKIYLVLYCTGIMPFMVYTLGKMPFGDQKILLYFFNIIMLLGPMLLVSERERFRSHAI